MSARPFWWRRTPPQGRQWAMPGCWWPPTRGISPTWRCFPPYRRRGVAGKLLDVFLRFARANHLAFLTLEVRPSNAAAIALYTRFGFRETGRRRNYYDLPREDALILTRTFGEDDQ